MLRLLFLLMGGSALRSGWAYLAGLGVLCIVASGGIVIDLMQHGRVSFPLHALGLFLTVEGIAEALRAIYAPAGIAWPSLVKSAVLMLLGVAVFLVPQESGVCISLAFAAAFLLDGGFRIISCCLMRCRRWTRKLTLGCAEMLFSVLIAMDWPLSPHVIVPVCFALLLTGWGINLLFMATQIHALPANTSVTALPIFTRKGLRAPHGLGYVHPPLNHQPVSVPLNIYIWTPMGSGEVAGRRPWFDRWVAAIDHRGEVSTGHTSLEMGDEIYISLYPADDVSRTFTGFIKTLRAKEEFDVEGFLLPSLEKEIKAWCRPDKRLTLAHYNQAALRNFWLSNAADTRYNLTSRNCSTSVIQALDVATEGLLGERGLKGLWVLFNPDFWLLSLVRSRAEGMTWTPGLVMDYSILLRRVLQPGNRYSACRRAANGLRNELHSVLSNKNSATDP
ncbi:HdeD family acid-resistance protein [Pantoea sp. NPDC088449]|uniref:Uncharacterized membrane protein HdeD, DUF308 family n=1 Tax=Candidatus Pantoea floridensis TaxID=1938870 RepID=A0A286DMR0_9GAMM|nr:uncharacterized membrane protein HdeD (DUF308 family) [Enterobacteriaceae bacterium JKS000233]SOD59899.1 Uncharacterized membrane protein HdeD, DUF308 family [Pantoea floridensis]